MGKEQPPEHRDLTMPVRDLIAHVQFKMDALPELAQRFHLGEEAVAGLQAHLQSEIDYLQNLPQEATMRDIMGNHFAKGAQFRERVTGKKDGEGE
ncbi:MAG: hypothetical protein AAB660_01995 [Patescibacteria group bacterium]